MNAAFDQPISSVIKEVNRHYKFQSEGGCSHAFLCGLVVAVQVDSADGFPVEIGGKGATPPYCSKCGEEPAPIFVRNAGEFLFYCRSCFESQTMSEEAMILDLRDSFFNSR
jgi:hypothetical protein